MKTIGQRVEVLLDRGRRLHGDRLSQASLPDVVTDVLEPASQSHDQPVDGLAPPTQAEVLTQAVAEGWSAERLAASLDAWADRRRTRP